MISSPVDLTIFNKFEFETKPVGVNYLLNMPEGVSRLEKKMALCEMLKEAQNSDNPFFTDLENHDPCGGPLVLGYSSGDDASYKIGMSFVESGRLGPKYEIFKHQVPNRRTLLSLPRFAKGTVKYVQFSPFEKITEDPEILVVTATPSQAEIIFRAYSYITGELWESKSSSILGCSWLLVYPHLTGKLNYLVTGLYFGMVGRRVWPDGQILISIPYDVLPMITQNLREMTWVLSSYKTSNRDDYMVINRSIHKEIHAEIEQYK